MADGAFFRAHQGLANAVQRHRLMFSVVEVVALVGAIAGVALVFYLHWASDSVIQSEGHRCLGNFSASDLPAHHLLRLQVIPPWLQENASMSFYATPFGVSLLDLAYLDEGDLVHQHEEESSVSSTSNMHLDETSWPQLRVKLLREFRFVYSRERALLFVKKKTRSQLGIDTFSLNVTASCFGNPLLQMVLGQIGYETFTHKLLAHVFNQTGSVYVFSEGEVINLNIRKRYDGWDWIDEVIHRILLLFVAFCSYLISDLAVGVALIESQLAILRFVLILRARQLFAAFVEACKVFAFIIMLLGACVIVGDLLEDRLVAVLAIGVFWTSKVYTSIACRCFEARAVYPVALIGTSVIYFVYCLTFGGQGFIYLAASVWAWVLIATIISLFLRYEIPALRSGEINAQHMRWEGFI